MDSTQSEFGATDLRTRRRPNATPGAIFEAGRSERSTAHAGHVGSRHRADGSTGRSVRARNRHKAGASRCRLAKAHRRRQTGRRQNQAGPQRIQELVVKLQRVICRCADAGFAHLDITSPNVVVLLRPRGLEVRLMDWDPQFIANYHGHHALLDAVQAKSRSTNACDAVRSAYANFDVGPAGGLFRSRSRHLCSAKDAATRHFGSTSRLQNQLGRSRAPHATRTALLFSRAPCRSLRQVILLKTIGAERRRRVPRISIQQRPAKNWHVGNGLRRVIQSERVCRLAQRRPRNIRRLHQLPAAGQSGSGKGVVAWRGLTT